jgi:hypothetical protein
MNAKSMLTNMKPAKPVVRAVKLALKNVKKLQLSSAT